jgi:hypothetical protein
MAGIFFVYVFSSIHENKTVKNLKIKVVLNPKPL